MIVISSESEEEDPEECVDGEGNSTEEEGPEEELEEEMETSEGEDPEEYIEDRIRPHFFELMRCWGLPRFGETRGNAEAKGFLTRWEARYRQHDCSPLEGLMMAECHLDGDAVVWWKLKRETTEEHYGGTVWKQFRCAFTDEYLTRRHELEMEEDGPTKRKQGKRVRGISGMVKVEGRPAYALFDTGSTHSHVDEEYAKKKGLALRELREKGEVMYTDGSRATISKVCKKCRIAVGGIKTQALLMVTKIKPLDVLIGMDWLSVCHAHIDCRKGEIEFRIPGRPIVKFQGERDEE